MELRWRSQYGLQGDQQQCQSGEAPTSPQVMIIPVVFHVQKVGDHDLSIFETYVTKITQKLLKVSGMASVPDERVSGRAAQVGRTCERTC